MIARFYKNREQPLMEHIKNTGEFCSKFAAEADLKYTGMLCGFLHDMGKYSPDFQEYIREVQKAEENGEALQRETGDKKVDHAVYGGKYLYEAFPDAERFRKLTRDAVCTVVTYHHGGLPDFLNGQNKIPMLERFRKKTDEEMKVVSDLYFADFSESDLMELFEKSCAETERFCKKFRKEIQKFEIGLLIKTLYSCLVDADRLDSYRFTLEEPPGIDFDNNEVLFSEYVRHMEEKVKGFAESTSTSPGTEQLNRHRSKISENCRAFACQPTGIYTLTVPTGGGKTFASLRFALHHCIKQHKKRIFYIMPYTTIVEQNAQAVRDILDCGDRLLEFHSNIAEENKIVDFGLISERFDSPIVFTTMVQFLNAFYAAGNSNIRRLHSFGDAVIVFDEIQTLPIKCMGLFYPTLLYLKDCLNTTSVLCTATQPDFDFIEQTQKIKIDGEIMQNVTELYADLKRMDVIDKTQKKMSCEELMEFVLRVKEGCSSVLVVMNMVGAAEELFDLLKPAAESGYHLILLTSRLCPAHRKEIIKDMKEELKNGGSVICVSTQLIEAGVDISFSSVIRNLCGLDSVAQAAGRGNRNAETERGKAYIVDTEEENVSSLPEITMGQRYTKDLLYYYHKDPEAFHFDLLSPEAVKKYYSFYYAEENIRKNMNYPMIETTETMVDLLSSTKARKKRYHGTYPLVPVQQFETAAKEFQVIQEATHSVIVPWNGEAEERVNFLLSGADLSKKYEVLKKLQGSTVSLYNNTYMELKEKGAFIPSEIENINLLSELFYDSEKGVVLEKNLGLTMF